METIEKELKKKFSSSEINEWKNARRKTDIILHPEERQEWYETKENPVTVKGIQYVLAPRTKRKIRIDGSLYAQLESACTIKKPVSAFGFWFDNSGKKDEGLNEIETYENNIGAWKQLCKDNKEDKEKWERIAAVDKQRYLIEVELERNYVMSGDESDSGSSSSQENSDDSSKSSASKSSTEFETQGSKSGSSKGKEKKIVKKQKSKTNKVQEKDPKQVKDPTTSLQQDQVTKAKVKTPAAIAKEKEKERLKKEKERLKKEKEKEREKLKKEKEKEKKEKIKEREKLKKEKEKEKLKMERERLRAKKGEQKISRKKKIDLPIDEPLNIPTSTEILPDIKE